MGLKNSGGGGEIVQVQGGHIMRATGRKDRHSKVFTAKGPRDRRVRLSAHTAIQFYDVQDRLGYDRPSKAVDWLMNKAKASIDKLAELPPWDPMAGSSNTVDESVKSTEIPVGDHTGSTSFQLHNNSTNVGFGSEGVGSHSFGCHDSMKSFFPTTSEDNQMSFQSYPHGLISRGGSQNQDLCLSLHSLQDPGVRAHQTHPSHDDPTLFSGTGPLGFDGGSSGGWVEQHHHQDMGRFTRLMGWGGGSSSSGGGNGTEGEERGGFLFNNQPQSLPPQALLLSQQGSASAYSQRGTLQSSFGPLLRALEDQRHHQQQQQQQQHPSISSIGHGSDGFMGFYFPSQLPNELHGGASMSNRASSSSLSPDSSQH